MPFSLVQPGDKFKPSATLSNAVRRHLNEASGFGAGTNAAKNVHIIRVPVFNTTESTIAAGKAVSLQLDGDMRGDAYPIVAYDEDYPCFGVSLSAIESGKIGDCVLSGIAVVEITGGTEGAYLKPVEGGGFELGSEGVQIINVSGGTNAVVLLGDFYARREYEAGQGINSDLITGGTVALNLVGDGSNITVTPVVGSTNGQMQVTFTGSTSGGGGLDIPPYSSLTFGGGAPDYGLGHTFILAVKAGDVGFYDDGGGAVGKWTNKSGTSTQYISGGTAYHATEDGWLRISVVDNGLAPGACLGFYSSTGGFPLYKYGSFSVSGIGYPDYIALAGGTASNSLGTITDDEYEEGVTPVPGPSTPPQNPKLGITSFLPVPAGTPIKYYASTAVLVRFAPVSGGGHYYYDLSNELEWTPNCAGWLRISILDDGSHSSDCFRLYVGGVQWSDAVPLYKCGTFQGGATGITSTVTGGTTAASITLIGGTGFVIVEPANANVFIDGSTNGRIRIGATGGSGSGFIPAWSNSGHTDVLPISSSTWGSGYVANADGWIFACAYFDPAEDRMRYKRYDAHVVVNNGSMKVCELKLPSGSAFIKIAGSNAKYYREPGDDWSQDPYAEHPYYSYFAWSAGSSVIYTSSVTPVIGDTTYIYDDVDDEFDDNQAEVEDTNSAAYAVGVGSGITIPVRAGATIYFIVTADGNAFYSRYSAPPCFCVFYSSNPPTPAS